MNIYAARIIALLSIVIGSLSIVHSVYFLYQYNYTNKLWYYMIPTYLLLLDLILGIFTTINGLVLFKYLRKANFQIAIICIVLLICLWLFM